MQHTKTEEEAFDTVGISVCTSITAGVDVRTVAGRLGHRNASTTLNVYAQFVPEADQAAAELLERGFAQTAG